MEGILTLINIAEVIKVGISLQISVVISLRLTQVNKNNKLLCMG